MNIVSTLMNGECISTIHLGMSYKFAHFTIIEDFACKMSFKRIGKSYRRLLDLRAGNTIEITNGANT